MEKRRAEMKAKEAKGIEVLIEQNLNDKCFEEDTTTV